MTSPTPTDRPKSPEARALAARVSREIMAEATPEIRALAHEFTVALDAGRSRVERHFDQRQLEALAIALLVKWERERAAEPRS